MFVGVTRLADRLVARFVPALEVRAASCTPVERFCYCQGGYRYTRACLVCDGGRVTCRPCVRTLAFCIPN